MAATKDGVGSIVAGLLMLIFGTASTIVSKYELGMRAPGRETCEETIAVSNGTSSSTSSDCAFAKPWFVTLEMKFGMACSLLLHFAVLIRARWAAATAESSGDTASSSMLTSTLGDDALPRPAATRSPFRAFFSPSGARGAASARHSERLLATESTLLPPPPNDGRVTYTSLFLMIVPAILDLSQTVIANIGLIFVQSSVYMMTRGVVLVFSAIFSVLILRKRMRPVHAVSVLLVILAIIMVGTAGFMISEKEDAAGESASAQNNTAQWLVGIALIVVAQVACALQIVVEEYLMTSGRNITPVLLVGMEGLWGCILFCFVAPILQFTPTPDVSPGSEAGALHALAKAWHEDFLDSFIKLKNSGVLLGVAILYVFVIGAYNILANEVTKRLSAVMRSILEVGRTLGVWGVALLLHYTLGAKAGVVGEKWDMTWSWLQVGGFTFLIYGTLSFKELVPLPFLSSGPCGCGLGWGKGVASSGTGSAVEQAPRSTQGGSGVEYLTSKDNMIVGILGAHDESFGLADAVLEAHGGAAVEHHDDHFSEAEAVLRDALNSTTSAEDAIFAAAEAAALQA